MTVSTVETERQISREAASFARWVSVLEPASVLAERIARTDFVPKGLRGNPAAVVACIMYGDEIGVGPMQALAGIHVIDGRPSPSSELLRALIFRAGHALRVVSLSGKSCTIAGKRRGDEEWTQIVWTEEMARGAGLYSKSTWNNYPRAMLLARASSELARIMFPDVVKGLAHIADDDESAAEFDSWATTIPDEAPAPASRTIERRRPSNPPSGGGDEAPPGAESPTGSVRLARPPDPVAASLAPPVPDESEVGPPPAAPPTTADDGGGPLPETDDAKPETYVNASQLKAIMAGFQDINCDNRTLRLEITRAVIGRTVETSVQLTRHEALQLIGALSDLKVGARTLEIDADGNVSVLAREENP